MNQKVSPFVRYCFLSLQSIVRGEEKRERTVQKVMVCDSFSLLQVQYK